jgi:F-type H+-transporting ATPase subunit c
MDVASAKLIGAGLAAMGMIGAGIGLGVLFGNYLQAAIRNPAGASSQQTMLFLGMALTETMGLFAFVISLIILFGSK